MLISELKKLKWSVGQISRTTQDAGTVVCTAEYKGSPLMLEFGWFLRKPQNEVPKIIRELKHPVSKNFNVDPDPRLPDYTVLSLIEDIPWRETLKKVIPKEAWG